VLTDSADGFHCSSLILMAMFNHIDVAMKEENKLLDCNWTVH